MSNQNNVIQFTGTKKLTRDDVIDQLERCQMAAEVTLPVERMQSLLLQLLGLMDKCTRATPLAENKRPEHDDHLNPQLETIIEGGNCRASAPPPFMYGIEDPDGKPHLDEYCVSLDAGMLADEVDVLGEGYRVVPLYITPQPLTFPERAEQSDGQA